MSWRWGEPSCTPPRPRPLPATAEPAWLFGGGGDSLLITAPAYQQGTPGLVLPCIAAPDGQLTDLGQPCRGVPDVAAQSGDGPTNGYGIAGRPRQDTVGSGTSLSSWMRRAWAERVGGPASFANETIYRLGKNATT